MRHKDDNGVCFADSVAHYLTALVQKRAFADAIEYYQAHVAKLNGPGRATAEAHLAAARAQAATSGYAQALRTARLAQAAASDEDLPLLAEIFMTTGGILRDLGEFKQAERSYRDAESIFRRNDCLEGQSRALNQLAGLFFRQSDYRNSLNVLMDAVDIARQTGDKKKLAFMMGNIGRICTFTGEFPEAIKHLKINIDLSRELGDALETARALLSLAYVHIQQGRYAEAETTLAEARPLLESVDSTKDMAIYLTYLGELEYRSGRTNNAAETLELAVAKAEQVGAESHHLGSALRHQAELHCRTGNFRSAQRCAAKAMVILEKLGDTMGVGALWKIKGVIAAARKQAGTGQACFKKAIDLLDESGVRWEMAEAIWTAGESPIFSSRQRMTYLFRAEEFFARTRNSRRLDEIGRSIAALEIDGLYPAAQVMADAETASSSPVKATYLTKNAEIQRFLKQIPMLGKSDLPVLFCGETGVGKDHMARYYRSVVRPDGPFVAINCASVPDTLLESELFGYHKGAFTGADSDKEGLFVRANGGVLFLDEIGDMPLALQVKLLGVLERRKVLPLGSTHEVVLDVKLVAATNQDLEAMVAEGRFRRDLYYRLSGMTFVIPPLRERREDIALLLEAFLVKRGLTGPHDKLPAELERQFVNYDWPGNVRELDNKVRRLEVMKQLVTEGDIAELARSVFTAAEPGSVEPTGTLFERVEEFERGLLLEALTAARGNKCEAARMLGVHEATVRTKLKRYGITYEPSLAV